MAQAIYNGNVGSALGLNYTQNVPLTRSGGPAEGIINYVRASIGMSTTAYGKTYTITVTIKYAGGTHAVTRNDIKLNSGNASGAWFDFELPQWLGVQNLQSFDIVAASDGGTIFVKGAQAVTVDYSVPTKCGAPSTASVSPALAESAPTLSAAGAKSGSFNAIIGYEIQYAESEDGSVYGEWTALKTVNTTGSSVSTSVGLPSQRGYYRKYRIRTMGAMGAELYSNWKETNAIRRNRQPSAPTTLTASPEVYVSGLIALAYSGAEDPDNNLSTYNLQCAIKTGTDAWGEWADLLNGATSHTPSLTAGQSIKYRVRAVDALGATSGWRESNICVKNTAPAEPVVNYPQAGKTIHNSRPRLLITMGADPEGHLQRVIAEGFTASRQSGLAAGDKVILRRSSAAPAGQVSYSVKAADAHNEETAAVSGSLTYAAPVYTDPELTAGGTRIKAAHVNELRTMVNHARQYYGLPVKEWAETITARTTSTRNWRDHITELRAAINEVVALVNAWDSQSNTNRIPSPAWVALPTKPGAAVMNQLRAVAESL